MTNSNDIVALVARWVFAERERKLRKSEARIAWMLAFKAGVELTWVGGSPDDGRQVPTAPNPEAKAALAMAMAARTEYLRCAKSAGSLRGALTKAVRHILPKPMPNAAIERAYSELCAKEAAEHMNSLFGEAA